MLITYEKTAEGNLKFCADAEAREEIHTILNDPNGGYQKALDYLIECVTGNGLEFLAPERIGALTSAPIFGEDIQYGDDGNIDDVGAVFWFPNYAVVNEMELLAESGELVFQRDTEPKSTPTLSP